MSACSYDGAPAMRRSADVWISRAAAARSSALLWHRAAVSRKHGYPTEAQYSVAYFAHNARWALIMARGFVDCGAAR